MPKRIIIASLLFLIVGFSKDVYSQDPIFSQFYGNPLYLNPALAGAEHCPRVVLNYRNQWPGIDGTVYATYSASYDQHFNKIAGAVGLIAYHDIAGQGSLTTTNISGIYNYHIQVSHTFTLKVALQGTWFQKSVDWSKLTFGDMIDRRKGFVYNTMETQKLANKQGWDFTTGIFGYTKNVYGGICVKHLTQPDEGLLTTSKLPLKFTGHAGMNIQVGEKRNDVSISPNILFQKQQDFKELNIGLYLKKSVLVSGIWYRNRDAVILLLGLQEKNFRIGYSYDVTISKLTNATYGAHEVSVAIVFSCKDPKKRYNPVNCPSF